MITNGNQYVMTIQIKMNTPLQSHVDNLDFQEFLVTKEDNNAPEEAVISGLTISNVMDPKRVFWIVLILVGETITVRMVNV